MLQSPLGKPTGGWAGVGQGLKKEGTTEETSSQWALLTTLGPQPPQNLRLTICPLFACYLQNPTENLNCCVMEREGQRDTAINEMVIEIGELTLGG